jgi:MFS family permease
LTITQFFYAASTTADSALQQKFFSDEQRSTLGSIISVASAVVNAGMALVVGMIADRIGPAGALIVLSVASLPHILIYARLFRTEKH